MLNPSDIRALSLRKYPSFVRALVRGEEFFPLQIPFGRPSNSEEWPKLQKEITALAGTDGGYRIEWAQVRTRRWGEQRMPYRVWFDDEGSYLQALGKEAEIDTLRELLAHTRKVCPELNGWLAPNALRLIEFSSVWRELLLVCRFFLSNPKPGVYARELPIAVDTKFVERHEGVLRGLLDFLLPEAVQSDSRHFARRFGLKHDEPQIRFRFLDAGIEFATTVPFTDLSVPVSQFAALPWGSLNVLIVENKSTFLSVPLLRNAMTIWGGGGAAQLLADAGWLRHCRVFYWGDIDIHGFHILSHLRRAFPRVASVMMDASTLGEFHAHCVPAKPGKYEEVALLNEDEFGVYERVRQSNLLLEQEKLPHRFAVERLRSVLGLQPHL